MNDEKHNKKLTGEFIQRAPVMANIDFGASYGHYCSIQNHKNAL